MSSLRVFVSYAGEDFCLARRLARKLQDASLTPVWDRGIRPGTSFTDVIRELITTAHVFMPLLTARSYKRPWVHQETGYALAVGVPVLPVAVKKLRPGEMIAGIQAIRVRADLSDLVDRIKVADLPHLVSTHSAPLFATRFVAYFPEERASEMVRLAVAGVGDNGHVRQRAIFSSLSIPDTDSSDPTWAEFDPRSALSPYHRMLLRQERQILESHSRASGCSLILHPFLDPAPDHMCAHRVQLQTLIDVLKSMPDDKVRIMLCRSPMRGNITLLGDWFAAYALPPLSGSGYQHTVFDRHAPTVLRWVREFDAELGAAMSALGVGGRPKASRGSAIVALEARLRQLRQRTDS